MLLAVCLSVLRDGQCVCDSALLVISVTGCMSICIEGRSVCVCDSALLVISVTGCMSICIEGRSVCV